MPRSRKVLIATYAGGRGARRSRELMLMLPRDRLTLMFRAELTVMFSRRKFSPMLRCREIPMPGLATSEKLSRTSQRLKSCRTTLDVC